MTTQKIYGPWIKWHGGECPVMRDQKVMIKLRNGSVRGPGRAVSYQWGHLVDEDDCGDIVEYCVVTEQPDLEAAENLLLANDYTVIPPSKPLTFKDVVPMTKAPPMKTKYWVVQPSREDGVVQVLWGSDDYDAAVLRHRMAYLDKEHALIAAKHIFGLKGGEL